MNRRASVSVIAIGAMGLFFAAVGQADPVRIPQRWASSGTTYAETDSLAALVLPEGVVQVYATSKEGDRVDVFEGETGKFIRSFGKRGNGPGELAYPNGIVAAYIGGYPIVWVVERDNHRVQAFFADMNTPLGTFGADALHRPYGCSLSETDGKLYLYVTDTEVPADKTVKVFEVEFKAPVMTARLVRSFGDAKGAGKIHEAESIAVDDRNGRVLLCDEDKKQHDVKVYGADGVFADKTFGQEEIAREPEGVALLDGPGDGLIILTDQQKKLSVWHLYDRKTLKHLGAFTGEPTIANTDGICVFEKPFGPFKAGAMFAVHDDSEIRAYALEDIIAVVRQGEASTAGP